MPIVHLLPSALQIGLSYQLALYDSLYIALAVDLNCPLVTVDDRHRNGAIASDVVVKPITDFSPV
ncbi:MAG: type II toxin-antitoxin system VapC family toxin [Coleofasciculus sp. B1-GNL1-01]|uniref:type II toxin-antitoxin system VapC family toxin n=1 Tax=Coleofasciculus sp. B1-GNL1-01 TaxID=3068484 RepID=UPI0032FF94CE